MTKNLSSHLDLYEHLVRQETNRQDAKWGVQSHDDCKWLAILSEEFGEVAKEANETYFRQKDNEELVAELIQVMAVCKQWLMCIDRREEAQ